MASSITGSVTASQSNTARQSVRLEVAWALSERSPLRRKIMCLRAAPAVTAAAGLFTCSSEAQAVLPVSVENKSDTEPRVTENQSGMRQG